ncbi:MAG TPA: ABC transporter ATP-binding protein [Candidatus Dormibacteraeota bacterium]|nr:ABC transporter ATP-binding protein [Candidatus Dormibacteraeota bacterium]
MSPIVRTVELTKIFNPDTAAVVALDHVSISIEPGEFVAVMGPSGSGKSTFMNIIGCLDRPTSGTYELDGRNVALLSVDQRADIRRTKLGFVFQSYNLLARTTALENVELPMIYAGIGQRERRKAAAQTLEAVGLAARVHGQFPNQLSGGQQQRVAIARALVNSPILILADEPTGALDSKTSIEIMELFVNIQRERKVTILMVTHEPHVAAYARRLVRFLDGRVESDSLTREAVASS